MCCLPVHDFGAVMNCLMDYLMIETNYLLNDLLNDWGGVAKTATFHAEKGHSFDTSKKN